MLNKYDYELSLVYRKLKKEKGWIALHPEIKIIDIIKEIVSCFMERVEYAKEVIKKETEIELLEWESKNKEMTYLSQNGTVYKFMPRLAKKDLLGKRGYGNHPEYIEDDYFSKNNNIDPQDISFNYVPYKMDSEFEQNALKEMLKLSEMAGYEIYFNGYKDNRLQYFWIQTPRGKYTPDFLILKRKENKKYSKKQNFEIERALIIETKGKPYYNEEFEAKEKFIKNDFLKYNQNFNYYCFVDNGKNDFTAHIEKFKKILKEF